LIAERTFIFQFILLSPDAIYDIAIAVTSFSLQIFDGSLEVYLLTFFGDFETHNVCQNKTGLHLYGGNL
jgi:hypothetical protein